MPNRLKTVIERENFRKTSKYCPFAKKSKERRNFDFTRKRYITEKSISILAVWKVGSLLLGVEQASLYFG